MKKVLFQIGTEYHYLVSLSLIDNFYASEEFEITFLVCKNPKIESRLNFIQQDEKYQYYQIEYDHNSKKIFNDVVNLRKLIKENHYYNFISFLFHDPLFVYLTYFFQKKGTKTFLTPDGMGAYVKFKTINFRSRLLNTFNCYRFLYKHGFYLSKFWFTSWDFGKNGFYNYIYAYSDKLPFLKNKKIIKMDYSLSEKKIQRLIASFKISSFDFENLENIILVVGDRHYLPEYESRLIKTLRRILPEYKLIYKKHPNQKNEDLNYLDENILIFDSVFPVELLIASIKNGLVISSYSNSMLYHNKNCKYIWTYPLAQSTKELKKPIIRYNPSTHITVATSFEDLEVILKK